MAVRRPSSPLVYGAVPRADLLPEAQRAERTHRQTLPKLLLAIVLSAALAAAIWAAGMIPVMLADQRLAASQAEWNDLLTQTAQHAEVQQSLGLVSRLSGERRNLTADEVLFVQLLDEIDRVLPSDVAILRYTGQLAGVEVETGEATAVDLDPLCVADSATLTVRFSGPDLGPAPSFVRGLESITGFKCLAGTRIEVKTDGGPQEVTVQIALDTEALAQRFEEAEE